jgi:hypothetical protein
MKNSISKTLLCGILASSFFIINCQKAPSRGVKAGVNNAAAREKLEGKVVAECTPSFLKSHEDARISKDKIETNVKAAKDKTKTLTEAEKAEIAKIRLDIKEKYDLAKAEMDKMKVGDKQAEGCKKNNDFFVFDDIKTKLENLITDAGDVAEVANDDIQVQVLKDKKDREVKTDAKSLSVNLELIISKELAAVIKSDNKGGVVYFKNGSIVKESSDYEKDKKSKSTTLCEIRNLTSDEALVEGDKLKILAMTAGKSESERKMYAVAMGHGPQVVSMACFIADGKEKLSAIEFRNAFGAHLLTRYQIDENSKKVLTKADLDKASEDLAKKNKTYDEATKLAKEANEAYELKLKEMQEAKDKKDQDLVKSLTVKTGELNAKKEKADKAAADALAAKLKIEELIQTESDKLGP